MTEYLLKTWSMIKSLTLHFAAGGSVPGLASETYVSFLFFMTHLSSYIIFCIFSLLKYDRIFAKNLEHDKVLDPTLCGWGVSTRFGLRNLC